MPRKLPLLLLIVFACSARAAEHFDGSTWWATVKEISNDKYQGRDTGSKGEHQAQEYIVGKLKALDVKPAGTNGYFQPVKLQVLRIDEAHSRLSLVRDGRAQQLTLGEQAYFSTRYPPAPQVDAPLVFVGYGLNIPERNYNDFAGLDLANKVAVIITGSPADVPAALSAHYQSRSERWKALKAAGAIGIIQIPNPASMDLPWARSSLNRNHPSMDLIGPEFDETSGSKLAVAFNPAHADLLLQGTGHSFAEIAALAKDRKPLPHFPLKVSVSATAVTHTQNIDSTNIVARIPGGEPKLKDENVVLSAHIDHVGIGEPINGDRIYNGAMDNGSGSALLLDIARSLKQTHAKLKRSVLLVWVTGEEKGLLGSKYFAEHPTVPAKSMVADINTDMFLPIVPLKVLTVYGLNESDLGDRAKQVGDHLNVRLQPDPMPLQNVFIRSDQYNFVRHGIPSLMIAVGADPGSADAATVKAWFTERYHAPSDDANQPVDLATAAGYEEVIRALAVGIANDPKRPEWKQDSFFRRYAQAGS
ncbi:MAG TPA: M28 family metallopeptidase [Steroidobacteraceae bacterium]|jgi:Zn-dependent M28 family amino/carboxypeptidase|nr:M28 family metallopeptidase [Steroidobacteraceae bacterium]